MSARSDPAGAEASPVDPLPIRRLEFLGGMAARGGWRPEVSLPEIAFAGRSNVGKSSLLNRLVRRRALARVSRTPGRTREINFFAVNDTFLLVDLPGYGYAQVAKSARHGWRALIESYLRQTQQLRGIVLLLDVRREPTDDDRAMLEFLAELEIPTLVAITKVDKLGRRARETRLAEIRESLGLDDEQVVPFSAHTGQGRDELAAAIAELVEQPAWRHG
jgi:GTP-binding protein